jgi:integrase
LTKRRTKGDGTLFQRADGMWIGRVELPPGPDGTRRLKTVSSRNFTTAASKLKALRADVEAGRIAVTGATTVEKWMNRWLTEIHVDKIRPTTRRDYATAIRLHIIPAIGAKRLDKLTATHIRGMHKQIGSRRAAVKAHVILKRALKDAVREGMVGYNAADMVDPPRYAKARRTAMTPAVARTVIAAAFASRDESEATRRAASFLTGARQGELLGLRWPYVDLPGGFADISWQLQSITKTHGCGPAQLGRWPCGKVRGWACPQWRWDLPPDFEYEPCHGSLMFTRPKTEAGGRVVPIVEPLLVKLRELHDHQGINPHQLVWHLPDGRPVHPRADHRAWIDLLRHANVIDDDETLPLHTVRHTTASLLRSAGVDEQTRMELVGHATADAQRIYAHADQARQLEAMSTLRELMP